MNKIDPFNMFITKYIIPLAYDESLSYYEQLIRISDKLNETIKSQNNVIEQFLQLKEWIDAQLIIYLDNKLDEWLETGDLSKKLQDYINSIIDPFMEQTNVKLSLQDEKLTQQDTKIETYKSETDNDISMFKDETNTNLTNQDTKIEDFKTETNNDISMFKDETNTNLTNQDTKIEDFKTETDTEILKFEAQTNAILTQQNIKISNNKTDTDNNITTFKVTVNQELDKQDNKINNIVATNSAPIVVTAVDEMTNSYRLYVLTTNNHLYYHNGTSFVDSGINYGVDASYFNYIGTNLTLTKDMNTFPSNVTIAYLSNEVLEEISNLPTKKQGIFSSYGSININGGVVQTYNTANNEYYIRVIWGATINQWYHVNKTINYDLFLNSIPYGLPPGLMSSWKTPMTCSITSDTSIPSDAPIQKQGIFTSFGVADAIHQIYATVDSEIYMRVIWGAFARPWVLINEPKEKIVFNNTMLMCYPKITCIGDSLTYSQVYTGDTTSRQAIKTYPQILGDILRKEVLTYAEGGFDPQQWWNVYNQNINNNGLFIIYLGTNRGLTNTVDADCIGDDYNNYADTLTGYYGRILQKIKSLGGQAIMVKVYGTSGDTKITNTTIESLSTRFNYPYIENKKFSDDCYHLYPDKSGKNGIHYNDLGYCVFADYILHQIYKMPNEFKEMILPQVLK